MKQLILVGCLIVFCGMSAQTGFSEENARQYIDVFFDGFHKQDTSKMRSIMHPEMRMQTAYKSTADGDKVSYYTTDGFLKMIADIDENTKIEERILDYKIEIDGNLATVWTPYQFYMNGKLSHCGANSFTLVATEEGWKIFHLIDSRRLANCNAPKGE